ncbi:MAG: hypothetical protein GWP59_00245 [Chlamydiales bacterium]|nr:hypothetical protein [Chlamydiales bacterium]NCF70109.1 hypothetical protein [Chlamydiales bacterium]
MSKKVLIGICTLFLCYTSSVFGSFSSFAVGGSFDKLHFFSVGNYGENYGFGLIGNYDGLIVKGLDDGRNRKEHYARLGGFLEYRHRLDEKVYVNAGLRGGGTWGKDANENTIEGGFFWMPYIGMQYMLTERFMLGGHLMPISGETYEANSDKYHKRWVGQVGISLYYML